MKNIYHFLKDIKLFFVVILWLLVSFNVAFSKSIKIAVVDVNLVLTKSIAAQKADSYLSKIKNSYKLQLEASVDNLKNKRERYEKIKKNLSSKARRTKEKEIDKEVAELRKDMEAKAAEVDSKAKIALAKIGKEIKKIVKKIARVSDYHLVLQREAVLFNENYLDITDKVIKQLNNNLTVLDYSKLNAESLHQ